MDPEVRGYPIDFRAKVADRTWPPPWLPPRGGPPVWVTLAQYGLGAHERYLCGEGEEWLELARLAGDYMLEHQEPDGPLAGGWRHAREMPHTYRIPAGWLSAMAQGEGASLAVRLHRALGEERYAASAELAMRPMRLQVSRGGVEGDLAGGWFPEEYPSQPDSHVLNGAIFALWGCQDVAVVTGSELGRELHEEGVETLRRNLDRWDLGYWSSYDLYPHPATNVASSAYHHLHVKLLSALAGTAGVGEFAAMSERFAEYSRSRANVARASAEKLRFRLLVPRNSMLAHRLPWSDRA